MASLKNEARYVIDEARDAICWLAVWKTGRSWHISTVWPEYDTNIDKFIGIDGDELKELQETAKADSNALLINGYYYNLGSLEDMTRDGLANALRWHYEDLRDAQLADALISLCE